MQTIQHVLVVGATGSIGRHVVKQALQKGYRVRALVRNPEKMSFDESVEIFVGDLTQPESLSGISDNIDGIIFTHGSYSDPEKVDYLGVKTLVNSLHGRPTRLVLMSTIYSILVGNGPRFDYRCAWKRRTERLIRASQHPYTIIRPGWFDCNEADQQTLFITQGRVNYALSSSDGAIAREQLAETLVAALSVPEAEFKTIELFAKQGERTQDFRRLFSSAMADRATENFDAINDPNNRPLKQEPAPVVNDLASLVQRKRD